MVGGEERGAVVWEMDRVRINSKVPINFIMNRCMLMPLIMAVHMGAREGEMCKVHGPPTLAVITIRPMMIISVPVCASGSLADSAESVCLRLTQFASKHTRER